MDGYKKRLLLAAVILLSLASVFWVMSSENFFAYDDMTLLAEDSLSRYDELFTFYPQQAYLDRPVRNLLLKLMYDLFGTDYTLYHVALALTHLLNVGLVYMAFSRVFAAKFGRDSDRSHMGGIVTAAVFGIWPRAHMAVQWISGNNDLMGTTFALLALLFFLKYRQDERFLWQNAALTLVFYYLAIRTKEMFYLLPLIFVLYECYEIIRQKRKMRISWGAVASLAVMAIFLAGIIAARFRNTALFDQNSPYQQSFHPWDLIWNLCRYCIMCFDLGNSGFYYQPSVSGTIGLALILIGLAAAIVLAIGKKEFGPLFGYVAIGFSIAMVLPQVNQVHILYLYYPMVFVAFVIACAVVALKPRAMYAAAATVMALCLLACRSDGVKAAREQWLSTCRMEQTAWNDMQQLEKPAPGSRVYVRLDDPDAYHPFYYGPGSVCRLLYQDATLQCVLLDRAEAMEYVTPYVVWEYGSDGRVRETERNMSETIEIVSVYPEGLPVSQSDIDRDTDLQLGVVPNLVMDTLKIYIDGKAYPVFYAEDFISTVIPAKDLAGKTSIGIELMDEYGTKSPVFYQPVIWTDGA